MDDGDRGQATADVFLAAALSNHKVGKNKSEARMTCIDCDEPIPEERRMAITGCQRCVICQQKVERGLV